MIWSGPCSPGNLIDVAVLGAANERPSNPAEIVVTVRRVGGARFQPVADVIHGRIAALARAGLLAPDQPVGERLATSQAGRAHLRRLLMASKASPDEALAEVWGRLKVCFLEALDPEARGAVIDDLLAAYGRELSRARAALEHEPRRSPFVRHCLLRDVERFEAELGWIEALRLLATGRAAA